MLLGMSDLVNVRTCMHAAKAVVKPPRQGNAFDWGGLLCFLAVLKAG